MSFLAALSAAGAGGRAWAVPAEVARITPGDVVAAYFAGGSHDKQAEGATAGERNSVEFATFLIDQAFELGLLSGLDECTRAWLDSLASVSVVLEHPHAVMLFDIRAEKADADSHRLASLHAALVMHTQGRNERIERRIQHLLRSYTNREETTLETIEKDGTTMYRLCDHRLADWVVVSWGRIGGHFVIAIGEGSFERVAGTLRDPSSSVGADRWFVSGVGRMAADDALLTVYVRYDELRRTSGPGLGAKIDRVQQALEIGGCERGLWTIGYAGRSVEIRQLLRMGSSDELKTLAGAAFLSALGAGSRDASGAATVPDSATAFAAIDLEPAAWFDRVRNAYLAGRSPGNRAKSCEYWGEIEKRAGVRFGEDIFAGLSGPIIIHDFPRHALRLPPAWTIVAPIRGDVDRLRRGIDALFVYWQRQLEEEGFMRLLRDGDGVWHLVVGVEGPALAVTDRHLVVSFSPQAVRQNVEFSARPRAHPAPK